LNREGAKDTKERKRKGDSIFLFFSRTYAVRGRNPVVAGLSPICFSYGQSPCGSRLSSLPFAGERQAGKPATTKRIATLNDHTVPGFVN